jgi:hypothetical protein
VILADLVAARLIRPATHSKANWPQTGCCASGRASGGIEVPGQVVRVHFGKTCVAVLRNKSRAAHWSRRFDDLRRRVTGINEKMLIQQLREMEADGIVTRRDF